MAKYGELFPGQGLLLHFSSLDYAIQVKAEASADLQIDGELIAWDRYPWSNGNAPPEVAEAWENVASAEYIKRDALKNNPVISPESLAMVDSMYEHAGRLVAMIKGRGYLVGTDGEKQYPKDGESGASNITVELSR